MTLTAPADLAAATPSRNDRRNDTAATCPACGQPFTPAGRRRWCSDACRQAAWRRRHPAPGPAAAGLSHSSRNTQAHERRYDVVLYLTWTKQPQRGQADPLVRLLKIGRQRCQDCGTFCRRIGPGGPCPHCDEPIAIKDLITVT